MAALKRELGVLYWSARDGRLDLADATKLTYVLRVLGEIIRDSDIEQRIRVLEAEASNHE